MYKIINFPVVLMEVKLDLLHKKQNRILKVTVGPKRYDVRGDWSKAKSWETSTFSFFAKYCIIRMIKSKKMKWAEHVARNGENRIA